MAHGNKGGNKGMINLVPVVAGEVRNPYGRGLGAKNKTTVVRGIINLPIKATIGRERFEELKLEYPELLESATLEEVMHIVQISKAILKGDTNAYVAVMNRCFGTVTDKDTGVEDKALPPPSRDMILMIAEKLENDF